MLLTVIEDNIELFKYSNIYIEVTNVLLHIFCKTNAYLVPHYNDSNLFHHTCV